MINNPYSSAIEDRRCLIGQINQAWVSRRERQCVDMNETCNSWHGVLVFGITKVSLSSALLYRRLIFFILDLCPADAGPCHTASNGGAGGVLPAVFHLLFEVLSTRLHSLARRQNGFCAGWHADIRGFSQVNGYDQRVTC
jgi:hypothetical protein